MAVYSPEKRLSSVVHIWLIFDSREFYLGAFKFKNNKQEKSFCKWQQSRYLAKAYKVASNKEVNNY